MRTEQDVLNDFQKLGWKIVENNKNWLRIEIIEHEIYIDKKSKYYCCDWVFIDEHKLLNELLQIWRWI